MSIQQFIDISVSLVTLTLLEVVLGIDNLVFIAIITSRLPKKQQPKARRIGLTLAWMMRLILLACAVWLVGLTAPLFHLFDFAASGRDIFLILGGFFLLAKATQEIHNELEPNEQKLKHTRHSFAFVITQIALLDVIFSLDSVLTAIGLTKKYWIMATAISLAIITMLIASEPLSRFIHRHPTVKMLALSFLILIGTVLIADGFHFHIPRGYIYFSIAFSILVEVLNGFRRKKKKVV